MMEMSAAPNLTTSEVDPGIGMAISTSGLNLWYGILQALFDQLD